MKPVEFDLNVSIDHISHWLPVQGPIKDFIHHNTLHAVQHYPFHRGQSDSARLDFLALIFYIRALMTLIQLPSVPIFSIPNI